MPIKYGELTIIHDKDSFGILMNLNLWMGNELFVNDKSKLLFIFDDDKDEIFESDNIYDYNYEFDENTYGEKMPFSFNKNNDVDKEYGYKRTYLRKATFMEKEKIRIDMRPLFSSCKKYNISKGEGSMYNCAYYYFNPTQIDIFGLMKIKSNEHSPRFVFAYDSNRFTKEEIVYLIKKLLNYQSKNN